MNRGHPSSIGTLINSQFAYWRQQREAAGPLKGLVARREREPFITISREYGCGGYYIAGTIAKLLNTDYRALPEWVAYDRKVLDTVMEDMGLSSQLVETLTTSARKQMTNLFQTTFSKFPPQVAVYRKLAETVRTLALHGHVVIVGRAGRAITRGMENGFHARIIAPLEWRVERMAGLCKITKKDAERMILEKSRRREDFLKTFVRFDSADPHNYHLTIDESEFTPDGVARLIVEGMRLRGLLR